MADFPSKRNTLSRLLSQGVQFGTVLDVGVHEQTVELKDLLGSSKHVLFEPAHDFFDKIHKNYKAVDYDLVPMAVSNVDGSGSLKKFDIDGKGVSHSTLVDPTTEGVVTVPTIRLDTYLKDKAYPKPYLLKIDIDGYEVPAFKGASGIYADIDCVIMEATRETLVERINILAEAGFQLYDIIDTCYYYGVFSQVDLVFVSSRVLELEALRPWQTREFTWDQWTPVASFEGAVQSAAQVAALARNGAQAAAPEAPATETPVIEGPATEEPGPA